jgi:hypothetical protein
VPKKNQHAAVSAEQIERQIHVIRGQRVMLDMDLAQLYGVTVSALNQAVQRNSARFPDDFAYRLTPQEVSNLKSQIVISSSGHGGRRRAPPRAFTEQGVAMLSSVLRSPIAVKVNIEIMRAFVRLRHLLATPGELVAQLTKLAETVQLHDDQIKVIIEALHQMMAPPPKPKGRIGFQAPERSVDSQADKPHSLQESIA